MIEVHLPFPPSTNNLFSQNKAGRRFPSPRYKRWRSAAYTTIMAARLPKYDCLIAVRVLLVPPSEARRDVDNHVKAVLDALVYMETIKDDSLIVSCSSHWTDGEVGARVQIGLPHEIAALPPVVPPRPPLTPTERKLLDKIKRKPPSFSPTNSRCVTAGMRALVEKGYARIEPGLVDGFPRSITAL